MPVLIDTHCHVNFREFKEDAQAAIQRSLKQEISLLVVGSQSTTSKRAVAYAEQYDGVWAVVGLHPVHLFAFELEEEGQIIQTRVEEFDIDFYKQLAQKEKVVAIGEMGLDYFRLASIKSASSYEVVKKQQAVFKQGIELAKELSMPLVIHTRTSADKQDVYEDVLKLIDELDYHHCVLHCFSGNKELAKRFIERGCMLSFTGIVTFKNARAMQEVVQAAPLESLMIETDAPFLSPEPHRGERNEPAYVKHVAEKIAELKGVSFDEVAAITTQNAISFFNLPVKV